MDCEQQFLVYQLSWATDWLTNCLSRLPRRLHIKKRWNTATQDKYQYPKSLSVSTCLCWNAPQQQPRISWRWARIIILFYPAGRLWNSEHQSSLKPSCPCVYFRNWITSDDNRTQNYSITNTIQSVSVCSCIVVRTRISILVKSEDIMIMVIKGQKGVWGLIHGFGFGLKVTQGCAIKTSFQMLFFFLVSMRDSKSRPFVMFQLAHHLLRGYKNHEKKRQTEKLQKLFSRPTERREAEVAR